jgi:hypothetical protein
MNSEEYFDIWRAAFGRGWFTAKQATAAVTTAVNVTNTSNYFHLLKFEAEGRVIVDRDAVPVQLYSLVYDDEPEAEPEPEPQETWQELAVRLREALPKSVLSVCIDGSTGEITVDQEVVTITTETITL